MRTRNGGTPKPAPAKKTPPTRKSAAKNQTPPPAPSTVVESPAETKRGSTSRGKQKKTEETTPTPAPNTPAVLETPEAKVSTGGKTTKTVAKRASARKTPASRGGKRGQKVAEPEVSKVEDEELIEQQEDENVEMEEKEEAVEPKDAMILEVVETAKFSPETEIEDTKTVECQKNDIDALEIPAEEMKIGDVRVETTETVDRSLEEKIVDKEIEECPKDVISPNKGETSDVNVHESIVVEEVVAENVQESIEVQEVVVENVYESIEVQEVVVENVHVSIEVEEVVVENVHESIEVEEVVAGNVHETIEEENIVAENVHESIEGEEVVAENVHVSIEEEEVVAENENIHESTDEQEDVPKNVHESVEEEEVFENVHESIEKEVVVENIHESITEEEFVVENVHESIEEEEVVAENVHESIEEKEIFVKNVNINEEAAIGNPELAEGEHHDAMDVDQSCNDQVMAGEEKSTVELDPLNSSKDEEPDSHMQEVEEKEKLEEEQTSENKIFNKNESISMVDDSKEMEGDYVEDLAKDCPGEDMLGKNQEDPDAKNIDTPAGDDLTDHAEEAEECMQLTAVAEERKIRKELEIFVGGLDCEAHEDDVKKVFEQLGEVVDVRLHKKDTSTDKSRGYAFVRFATKEQASRALSELKNPLICGKKCETAPCKDNDTLFLGNICNTWTKEAIILKMKEYGIESVMNITLVSDPRREGLSRGFAFLEFPCHAEALLAYKRLQKSDVVFGHAERTAKVAFAEPLREPDPEVLAQVKSVFLDGVPPDWDEEKVREHFKSYGEVIRITLSKNISTAKRKDFGFVDYSSHEAAVACVDDINNKELGDMKTKVKVSLSNPMPKTQAVKGGMSGGFKIDRPGTGSSSKAGGRGFGRGGSSNRSSFQRGRGFNPRGRGQFGRTGFAAQQHGIGGQRPPFHGRQMFGRGGGWRAPSHISGGGGTIRPSFEGLTHNATNRGREHTLDRRPPFSSEGGYPTPYRRPFEEPRFYEDNAHGMKRPHFMTEPDYMEPNRIRPRFDYSAPSVVPFQGTNQRDTFGASGSRSSQDYYNNSNYGQGAYRPPYGGEVRQPYGGEVRPPYGGEVQPPYGGEVQPPYGGEVRPQRGDFRPPYVNPRPPFGEGGRPYGGRNYYY
ncbi:nucleolin-like [Impatiens glandulifera]|uniref:nucleolin-like n=1 Tax=Impatiens glandulifera TaxID=253017 RepID=UPI001FB05962|nr:nucleolin-like [Impatiens glandulifera]